MRKALLITAILFCATTSRAACTGSGLVWACPNGASVSDISTAISSATDGAVISVAAGSFTWNSRITPSLSKGLTIICATPGFDTPPYGAATSGGCNVSTNTTMWGTSAYAPGNTKLYRFSGFNITTSSSGFLAWFCPGGNCTGTFVNVRFDHNTINAPGGAVVLFSGEQNSLTYMFGVMDHNHLVCPDVCFLFEANGEIDYSTAQQDLGTMNNMFIETNQSDVTTITTTGNGVTDGWSRAANIVYRYNISTNDRMLTHGVAHNGGPSNVEVYNNNINQNSGASGSGLEQGYRSIHHQGSNTFIVFGNSISPFSQPIDPGAITVQHYRDEGFGPSGNNGASPPACDGTVTASGAFNRGSQSGTFGDGNRSPSTTWYGYPCYRQPGRDTTGAYKPIYVWNNVNAFNGAKVDIAFAPPGGTAPPGCTPGAAGNCDYSSIHIVANREYYNAVSASAQSSPTSPFDGTTGMGFGTLANRPTTCTTNSEGGAGVGYFATDVGAQGTLYTCSATNTWTVYYVPCVYPHPLVTGGNYASGCAGGSTPAVPASPKGLFLNAT